ncbi:hypothetical protein Ais01nite_38020 [Asanoa ishikariensis]|uniref:ABC-2 type transport system permease protein n=1 Tax=Asanoa ishikariensis TaxID=137265 RepID=A0A1H3LZ46_9ACTN|nr:hypothetical protein [Asanoa ishikariensis]GIF65767.1 hypothetical protein Ais01nite_38020 [Asanoa ishikariensis]SDY69065.1 hypothetical protein SAMN05421684_1043 [Asanoa ishikariensis]
MTALVRMRLTAYLRSGRALPGLLGTLVVVSIIYGGGKSDAAEAYGFSAVALFPVIAWQAKLLLDTEPDVQRRLAVSAVGLRREVTAGLLAAGVVGLVTVALAMVLPWLVGGITGPGGIGAGLWAHAAALVGAVGLGALASRPITRSTLYGVAVLVTGSVLAIVLGLDNSVAPWLAPPLMATARHLAGHPDSATIPALTIQAALWAGVVGAIYARLRRTRG